MFCSKIEKKTYTSLLLAIVTRYTLKQLLLFDIFYICIIHIFFLLLFSLLSDYTYICSSIFKVYLQYGIGTLLVYIYMYKCTFKTVIASDNPVAGAIYNLLTYLFSL